MFAMTESLNKNTPQELVIFAMAEFENDQHGFWHNQEGWSPFEGAQYFPPDSIGKLNLPTISTAGGRWNVTWLPADVAEAAMQASAFFMTEDELEEVLDREGIVVHQADPSPTDPDGLLWGFVGGGSVGNGDVYHSEYAAMMAAYVDSLERGLDLPQKKAVAELESTEDMNPSL
jgi:hypothetical protein